MGNDPNSGGFLVPTTQSIVDAVYQIVPQVTLSVAERKTETVVDSIKLEPLFMFKLRQTNLSELVPFFARNIRPASAAGKKVPYWEMEKGLWFSGESYYRSLISDDCVMVFPDPTGVLVGEEITSSMSEAPRWNAVTMLQPRITQVTKQFVLLTYKAEAHRDSNFHYRAYCSSAYAQKDSQWLLVYHQHTPATV
ncbi:hypothetical protein [Phyllobacterium sp. K27]